MARNVFTVNATQVVVSENNPQGLFSVMSGFPQTFDSHNYNDDPEAALRAAFSVYYDRLSKNYTGSSSRVMATVTLSQANGQLVTRDSLGGFPVESGTETETEQVPEIEEIIQPEEP